MSRLLIVDDEFIIAYYLQELLGIAGHEVVGLATTGEEGVRMAHELNPDIVLMDIVMPGKLDGISSALMIEENLKIPIVFITAHSDTATRKKAERIPNHGYIVKPFQIEQVTSVIKNITG